MPAFPALNSAAVGRGLRLAAAIAALSCAPLASAVPTLVAIGSDANGVGRAFVPIDPAGPATLLGDGSLAFNGGLAYRSANDSIYAIANDSFGASSLASFATNAPASISYVSIGTGFYGGLAFDPGADTFYAIASDSSALSTLYRVDRLGDVVDLGTLGYGYFGGLTFDATDGLLYAISGDDNGVQRRVERIDPLAASVTATTLFDLGTGDTGFDGGLVYDPGSARFLTIGNDADGNSGLYAFDGTGSLVDLAEPLGTGFMNAGLAFADLTPGGGGGGRGGTVPEPSTAVLLLIAAVMAHRIRSTPISSAAAVAHLSRRTA